MKIVNRGTYTNARKAQTYVNRELAVVVDHDEHGRIIAIQMLDSAELAVLRSLIAREKRVENHDDGIARRWVNRRSGARDSHRIPVKQLRPIAEVGTAKGVTKKHDTLIRRQVRIPEPTSPGEIRS